jgi:hypothetical protein
MSMNILPFGLQNFLVGVRDYNPNFNYDKMKIQSRSTLVFSKAFQDIFDKKINIFYRLQNIHIGNKDICGLLFSDSTDLNTMTKMR